MQRECTEKIGQAVWQIEINKAVDEKSYRPNGIVIEKTKIIGISKFQICIQSDWFEKFYIKEEGKRRSSHENYLNDINVNIRTNQSILGDGVFVSMTSTKKPTKRLLKKMVAKANNEIDKRYGFLMGTIKDELYNFADNYKI